MGVTPTSLYDMKITRRTRMVNDVPMETIYEGMSRDRFRKIMNLYNQASDNVDDMLPEVSDEVYFEALDIEFRALCKRAASKAGWHNNKRTSNNKKKVAA